LLTLIHYLRMMPSIPPKFRGRADQMITAAQLGAGRVLVRIGQLAQASGLALPTIHRMEAGETMVQGNADPPANLIAGFPVAPIDTIYEGADGPSPTQTTDCSPAETCLYDEAESKAWYGRGAGA
jgi:hypothetical protein